MSGKGVAPSDILGVYNPLIYQRFLTLFLGFVFPYFGHFPPPSIHTGHNTSLTLKSKTTAAPSAVWRQYIQLKKD